MEKQIREEEEEEEMSVEYMDSDEEVKKRKKKLKEELEQEEEEEQMYSSTPMEEWIPAEPPASADLRFRPAEFPPSRQAQVKEQVRSTILGQYGRCVFMGAPPEELPLHKCCSSSALMVSSDQLQAHLAQQANRFQPGGLAGASRWRTEYELKAAVAPWVGNLVIPSRSRRSTADGLREQAHRRALSSTPIFLLFLQTMNVDSVGCMEMIRRREREEMAPAPPDVPPRLKDPRTLAGMLQRRKLKQQLQDVQQGLDLGQVQQVQKLVLQPCPAVPQASQQKLSGGLLELPPQTNAVLCPRAVFVPQPPVASFQLLRPASIMPLPPSSKVIMAVPLPAPPRPTAPPASAGSGVSWCVFPPSAAPPPPDSTPYLQPTTASTINSPLRFHDYTAAGSAAPASTGDSSPRKSPTRRKRRGEEEPRSSCDSQPDPAGSSGPAVEGKRLRKLSQKARAFQEATRAKVRS